MMSVHQENSMNAMTEASPLRVRRSVELSIFNNWTGH